MSSQLKFYSNVINLVYPKEISLLYVNALRYRNTTQSQGVFDGWYIYHPQHEYSRFNALTHPKLRITEANSGFAFSKTYPEFLVVPHLISDKEVIDCASFRTKARFPTLSYIHKNGKGSLWRSSQPKSGLTNNRNSSDELMLRLIKEFSDKFIIYDARPYLNAMGNRVKGGGSEVVENYNRVRLVYCEIDNIHAVSSAYLEMFNLSRR